IVTDFANEYAPGQVRLIDGPRQGATRNFLSLTRQADPKGWLAYADQDDFWLPDRLERGVAFLSSQTGAA
ncbi:MAG TPA: glycosyltransferase, partial [Paracoccus sp. (in: a-proteobacteria)]|nr:glycosyltransferase [Paracoccus sp. (in: a-proteobacteria)]